MFRLSAVGVVLATFAVFAALCSQARAFPIFHQSFQGGKIETNDLSVEELYRFQAHFLVAQSFPHLSEISRQEAAALANRFATAIDERIIKIRNLSAGRLNLSSLDNVSPGLKSTISVSANQTLPGITSFSGRELSPQSGASGHIRLWSSTDPIPQATDQQLIDDLDWELDPILSDPIQRWSSDPDDGAEAFKEVEELANNHRLQGNHIRAKHLYERAKERVNKLIIDPYNDPEYVGAFYAAAERHKAEQRTADPVLRQKTLQLAEAYEGLTDDADDVDDQIQRFAARSQFLDQEEARGHALRPASVGRSKPANTHVSSTPTTAKDNTAETNQRGEKRPAESEIGGPVTKTARTDTENSPNNLPIIESEPDLTKDPSKS